MRISRNRVLVKGLLGLVFALLWGLMPIAQAQQPDAAGSQQEQVEESAPGESEQGATEAEDEEADETDEESPSRFIPTEQISQDLGVSFPADI